MIKKRNKPIYIKGLFCAVVFVFFYFVTNIFRDGFVSESLQEHKSFRLDNHCSDCEVNDCSQSSDVINLVVVACLGNSESIVTETMNMIKSALIFTRSRLQVHVFTTNLKERLEKELSSWPNKVKRKFDFTIHPLHYPLPPGEVKLMMDWWGPCASFRLFLPTVMTDVDSVIYVDTDVIFMGPVDDLWAHFRKFNPNQVGGLAPRVGWEFKVPPDNPNFIPMPDGKLTQVNSGVFLMNLTRMRAPVFQSKYTKGTLPWRRDLLLPIYKKRIKDMFGDQNLINTVFHFNPERLYYIPCRYNYHHKFCFDNYRARFCSSAEEDGAFVVHGNANTYYNNYAPAFRVINDVMTEFNFEDDLKRHLLAPMLSKLKEASVENHPHCGNKTEVFIKALRHSITQMRVNGR